MSDLERDVMFRPGATFYKEGKFLMFRFQADSASVIGPRVATEADKKAHAFEYDRYLEDAFNSAPLEAFDHDGVDGPGGVAQPVSDDQTDVVAVPETIPAPKKRGRPAKA